MNIPDYTATITTSQVYGAYLGTYIQNAIDQGYEIAAFRSVRRGDIVIGLGGLIYDSATDPCDYPRLILRKVPPPKKVTITYREIGRLKKDLHHTVIGRWYVTAGYQKYTSPSMCIASNVASAELIEFERVTTEE